MLTPEEQNQMNAGIAAAQRELIQGYYNRIHLQNPTIDEIMEWLQSDLLHVTKEDLVIDAKAILNQSLNQKYPLAFDTIKLPVRYDASEGFYWKSIVDADGNKIARAWYVNTHTDHHEQRQDQIGELIAHLLNELQ